MEKRQRKKIAIISITSYYARQIFNKTKVYEFRKSPLKNELLNKKIYVYSAKQDKAIIGCFRVKDILVGNINEILHATGYDKRVDGQEIIDYYGKNNKNCFALCLYDIVKFKEALFLSEMRSISNSVTMPQYIKYIYEDNPLYEVIIEWEQNFSSNNNKNIIAPVKIKQMILNKAKLKGSR